MNPEKNRHANKFLDVARRNTLFYRVASPPSELITVGGYQTRFRWGQHTPRGIRVICGLPSFGLHARIGESDLTAGETYFLPSCSRVLAMIMRRWFASLLSGGRPFISRSHSPSACLYSPF